MISQEQVEKLAALARLELESAESAKLAGEIDSILAYAGELSRVAGEIDRTKEVPAHRNIMRADGEPHQPGIHTGVLLDAAPAREGKYFKVKKILS
jgi:aspartyl-tRNA(Asn)/glutamyl-tRNA(Gln) amidotransferase subunit C